MNIRELNVYMTYKKQAILFTNTNKVNIEYDQYVNYQLVWQVCCSWKLSNLLHSLNELECSLETQDQYRRRNVEIHICGDS